MERDFRVRKKAYIEVAETVLGRPQKKKKQWISKELWDLIDQREGVNKRILSTRSERVKRKLRADYVRKDREMKRSIKVDKRKWIDNITGEAEKAARKQHMKNLYGLTKTLCKERPKQSTVVLDKNGNLLSGKDEVQSRSTEHFKELIKREEPENPITSEEDCAFEFNEIIEEIAVSEPTLGEVKEAINRL